MRAESVRALKSEISAEIVDAAQGPEARSFFEATEPPMPEGVALGVALADDGEHLLAIRTDDPAKAAALSERAHGEADVRIITVTKRATPAFLQGTVRPLEAGAQVAMKDMGFVGTLGCFVRDANGVLYALSNSHVLADEGRAQAGHVIGQPFGTRPIGVLSRWVPFSRTMPNTVDAAIMRVDRTDTAYKFNAALGGDLIGSRALTADDLHRPVRKVGRTTGARQGMVSAVEIDGLPVGYDAGILRFNDAHEFVGATGSFSAGGDSGSLIVDGDGYAVSLLFAGGPDSTGVDRTFGNPIRAVLGALGVELAL